MPRHMNLANEEIANRNISTVPGAGLRRRCSQQGEMLRGGDPVEH